MRCANAQTEDDEVCSEYYGFMEAKLINFDYKITKNKRKEKRMSCEALFQPITIGNMTLKNRIMLPGMTTRLCLDGGYVSDEMIAYYSSIARGGCGLIVVEATSVHAPTAPKNFLRICGDEYIPGLKKLTDAVHQAGAKISVQLWQGGFCATATDMSLPAIVPSDMEFRGVKFAGASKEVIQEVAEAFGSAAKRASEAGFDSVEFHCGHQYSPAHFLSGFNKRTDEYGGDLEGRAHYPLDCIRAIRANVPSEFPVGMRVVAQDDCIEDGNTLDDTIAFINMAAAAGVDFVNISRGNKMTAAFRFEVPSMYIPKQFNLENAVKIKQGVTIPVVGGGRIVDPEDAVPYVESGKLDMIFIGRPLICDPELCKKAKEGRLEDIVRCLSCNQGCLDNVQQAGGSQNVTCLRNPFAGHELKRVIKQTAIPKRVVVIGGGMGGMEAARVLHERGHKVTLLEAEKELGGQFICAGQAPHKEVLAQAAKSRGEQIIRSGIDVRLGVRADEAVLEELKPEAVIVACGAQPIRLNVPGADMEHVYDHVSVLMGQTDISGEAVVIGGGLVGIECALYLADKGCQVTIVEMKERIGADISGGQMIGIMMSLQMAKINQVANAVCEQITHEGVVVEMNGEQQLIPGKSVVVAVGSRSTEHAWAEDYCRKNGIACSVIGDAKKARRALQAIQEGVDAALSIE